MLAFHQYDNLNELARSYNYQIYVTHNHQFIGLDTITNTFCVVRFNTRPQLQLNQTTEPTRYPTLHLAIQSLNIKETL